MRLSRVEQYEIERQQQRAEKQPGANLRDTVILDIPQHIYEKIEDTPELKRLMAGKKVVFEKQAAMDKQTGKVDLPLVYRQRIDSLQRAIMHIIDAQPPSRLNPLVQKRFQDYVHKLTDNALEQFTKVKNDHHFSEFVKVLEDYTTEIAVVLVNTRLVENATEAGHLMDLGEAYMLVEQGRASHGVTTQVYYPQESKEQDSESMLQSGIVLQVEEPVAALSTAQAQDYETLVLWLNGQLRGHHNLEWVDVMSANERILLFNLLSKINPDPIEEIAPQVTQLISSIPSKLRSITGMANKSRHHLFIFDNSGKKKHYSSRIRHAYPSPRDFKQDSLRKRQTMLNIHNLISGEIEHVISQNATTLGIEVDQYLDKIIQDKKQIPVLLQSLITPMKLLKWFGNPDPTLHEDKIAVVPILLEMIETKKLPRITAYGRDLTNNIAIASSNYPLNTEIYEANKGYEFVYYIDKMKTQVQKEKLEEKHETDIRHITLDTLQELYKLTPADLNPRIPRLVLASLECAMGTYADAMVNSGCISAKDRELLVTMLTDALIVFVEHYNTELTPANHLQSVKDLIVAMDKKKYKQFPVVVLSNFFAQFVLNGSGQTLAASNAPGCLGFKTPDKYLSPCPFLKTSLQSSVSKSDQYRTKKGFTTRSLGAYFEESEALADKNDIGKKLVVAKKFNACMKEKGEAIFDEVVQGIGADDEYILRPEQPKQYSQALKLIHQIASHPKFGRHNKIFGYNQPKEITAILTLLSKVQEADLKKPAESPVINEIISLSKNYGRAKSSDELSRFLSAISDLGTPIHDPAVGSLRCLRDEMHQFNKYNDHQREFLVVVAQIISHPTYWDEKTSGHKKPTGVYEMLAHFGDQGSHSAEKFIKGLKEIIADRGESKKRDIVTDDFYNFTEKEEIDGLLGIIKDAFPNFDVQFLPSEHHEQMEEEMHMHSPPRSLSNTQEFKM